MKLLSLFSGIGAFEKALTNLDINYELVGFSEIDKWAIESYSAIHNVSTRLNLGDVRNIRTSKLPNDIDIITHGSPCQDFSVISFGEGGGKGSGTRSSLMWETVRIIRDTQPKYIIWENVKGSINKRNIDNFNLYLETMNSLGYTNHWDVLNSIDFSVPQKRERVFVVSIHNTIRSKFNIKQIFKQPNKLMLLDLLDNNVPSKYYLPIDRFKDDINRQTSELVSKPKKSVTDIIQLTKPKFSQQRLYSPFGVSPTIPAGNRGGGKEPTKMLFVENNFYVVRKLTPLETWRLMGFKDEDYWKARRRLEEVFYNGNDRSDTQMYKQAGNSIVVPIISSIFKSLLLGEV